MGLRSLAIVSAACIAVTGCSTNETGARGTGPNPTGGYSGGNPTGGNPTGGQTSTETSAQSLVRQQMEHGWSDGGCPSGAPGTMIGQQLAALVLSDCEGNPVPIESICGSDAAWLFFAHGW